MTEPVRVEITEGELAGRHVLVDKRKLNGGFLEDMQSGQTKLVLDALSRAIVGGDLPEGTDRAGLRELPYDDLIVLSEVVSGLIKVPKR